MRRTWELVRFIRKNRRKKKKKLYKLAFGVAIDRTISIYLSFFIFIGLFIIYDELKQLQPWFLEMETTLGQYIHIFIAGLFLRAIILSFYHPGILFTSAEFKMITLPYLKKHVWLITFIETIIKNTVTFILILFSLILFTPITEIFLLKWIGLAMVVTILLILPQWYLFQLNPWRRVFAYIIAMLFVLAIRFLFWSVSWYFIIGTIVLLILINCLLWQKHLSVVDWMRVIQESDTKVWNMFFVNQMSKMGIKQENKPLLQQLFRSEKRRRPFPYQHDTIIYRKLWKVSLAEEKEHFIQAITVIILCLVVLSFQNIWLHGFSMIISVFGFNKITASYFNAGFKHKIVHSLPWDMDVMKRAFLYRMYPILGLVSTVAAGLLIFHGGFSVIVMVQLVQYLITIYVLLHLELEISINKLDQRQYHTPCHNWLIGMVSYVMILLSFFIPLASIYALFLLIYYFHIWKKKKM